MSSFRQGYKPKTWFLNQRKLESWAGLDSLAVVHSPHVMHPSSLWRLAVAAFYATFAVCICREHYSEAITQLAKSVVDPVQVCAPHVGAQQTGVVSTPERQPQAAILLLSDCFVPQPELDQSFI